MPEPNRAVHAHPIVILQYLWRFLFLLIIPLLRGFLYALRGGLLPWLRGAWLDLLVVGCMVTLSWWKWRNFQYYMDETAFYYTTGIFFQQEFVIPLEKISSFTLLKPFWLRPFGVVRLRLDTIAHSAKQADLELYLDRRQAQALMDRRRCPPVEGEGGPAQVLPSRWEILGFSLFTSNSLWGILFVSTFVSQAGKLVGQRLDSLLFNTFEELAQVVLTRLPPVLGGLVLLLVGGWLVAFGRNLLQAKGLYAQRTPATLQMGGGVLVNRESSLRLGDLSYLDLRQSLLTRLLGRYSVFVSGIGLGKGQEELPVLSPFANRAQTWERLERMAPEFLPVARQLRPNRGALMKFLWLPLLPCLLLPAATQGAAALLPSWRLVLEFSGGMLLLPALWFLGVRVLDFCSAGAGYGDGYYTIYYSRLFSLHCVIFSADKVAQVQLQQSPIQRVSGRCDVLVYTRAEGRQVHRLRNLELAAARRLFGLT